MGLVCNNRAGALEALAELQGMQPSADSAQRLQRMRGRPAIATRAELESSERWQRTRAWLASWAT